MPEIDPAKVCYIIVKAREFDVKEGVVEPDPGSNPADDDERAVLADYPDDPVLEELEAFIGALNVDEQVQLVALAWIGRGDFTAGEWDEVVDTARARRVGPTARYLLGIPLLGDYLEEGLSQFDLSCEEFEIGRL
jgi:hypothetical protein